MSNIDERIVSMQFNNKQFEAGAKESMSTMDKLKSSLKFEGATQGLSNVADAAKGIDLSHLGSAADAAQGKFSALATMAFGALASIGAKAADMGLNVAKSLTIEPIKAGFDEYELKLGSIQTILANTEKYGTTLPQVTAALDDLNAYSDRTIYNFGDMTKNVGLFTNAGIKIEDATSMIKGFSNAAAASGTSAEGASSAAYQLSQALSNGTVRLQDWKSLTTVGMGNENMKSGLIDIAKAMGTLTDKTVEGGVNSKNFNETLEKGWLSADVMSSYLKIMAGDMDAASMSALGLSDAQIASFQQTQATAQGAAQNVRTFTQLMGTLKESVGSGWSQTAEIVVGNFDEATTLFTGISNELSGVVNAMSTQRNAMLQSWKDLHGRDDVIAIGQNLYNSIKNIIKPITDAWAKIFPPKDAGAGLKAITGGFRTVSEVILKFTDGITKLQPVWEVLFGVLKIGIDIVKGLFTVFTSFLGIFAGVGTGGVLGLAGGFAALIAKVTEFINQGQLVQKFFDGITHGMQAVLGPTLLFFDGIKAAFGLLASGGSKVEFIDAIKNSFTAFAPLVDTVVAKIDILVAWFRDLQANLRNTAQEMGGGLGKAMLIAAGLIGNFSEGLKGIQDILLKGDFTGQIFGFEEDSKVVGWLFNVRDAFTGVKDSAVETGNVLQGSFHSGLKTAEGTGNNVVTAWDRIKDAFLKIKDMLGPVMDTLGKFFSYIGGLVKKWTDNLSGEDVLALINTGMFVAFYASAKKFFDDFGGLLNSAKGSFDSIAAMLDTITGSLEKTQKEIDAKVILEIAISIGILAVSLYLLAQLDAGQLATAGGAIVALLGSLMATLQVFKKVAASGAEGDMLKMGASLILVAIAIDILAVALKKFGEMDTGALIKGVLAVTVVLGILAGAMLAFNKAGGMNLETAASLVILSVALMMLQGVILLYSLMDWNTVGEGLGYMAVVLGVLGGAMRAFPAAGAIQGAAALVIVAVALAVLKKVIDQYASMDLKTVAEGLAYMMATIAGLGLTMMLLEGALPGALALVIVAGALAVLGTVIEKLAGLSIQQVGIALLALLAPIVLLGVAALVMTPIIPVMMALGIALALIGASVFLAGAGLLMAATALGIFAAVITVAGPIMMAYFTQLIGLIPLIAQQIGLGIVAIASVIGDSGPVLVEAFVAILHSLIQAVIDIIPDLVELIGTLIKAIDTTIRTNMPVLIELGWFMLKSILDGINKHMPELVKTVGDIIVNFIKGIDKDLQKIIDAGTDLLVHFIQGLDKDLQKIIDAGTNLIVHLIKGIGNSAYKITTAAGETLITFLNGMTTWINNNSTRINTAMRGLVDAIVNGIVTAFGLGSVTSKISGAVTKLTNLIPDGIKDILHINSPSKVVMDIMDSVGEGMVVSLDGASAAVMNASSGLANDVITGLKDTMSNADKLINGNLDVNPVIKPVLDLTDVEAGAKKIDSLVSQTATLSVGTSADSAFAISAAQQAQLNIDTANAERIAAQPAVQFNQFNSSPKALTPAEIYRQTKNQLSVVKGGLPT